MKLFPANRLPLLAILLAVFSAWAPAARGQVVETRALMSVVTIKNTTPDPIEYRFRWPGRAWTTATVEPNSSRIHWAVGQGQRPVIRFPTEFDEDSAEETVTLYAADFVRGTGNPSRAADGLIYAFGLSDDEDGLVFHAVTPLDKSRFREERDLLEFKYQATHPNLLTNYEVLGPSSEKRTYNCVAWSLGIKDKWVWPGDRLEDFDRLYAKHGYRRASGMDLRAKKGVHKIVLYGQVNEDGTVNCKHVAKQAPNGTWTSKLGRLALIRHLRPEDVNGPSYGEPVAIYVKNDKK
jgi:hypothetical protein